MSFSPGHLQHSPVHWCSHNLRHRERETLMSECVCVCVCVCVCILKQTSHDSESALVSPCGTFWRRADLLLRITDSRSTGTLTIRWSRRWKLASRQKDRRVSMRLWDSAHETHSEHDETHMSWYDAQETFLCQKETHPGVNGGTAMRNRCKSALKNSFTVFDDSTMMGSVETILSFCGDAVRWSNTALMTTLFSGRPGTSSNIRPTSCSVER